MTQADLLNSYWIPVLDGDDRARGIFNRHYSKHHYKDERNPRLFVGPGEKIVLMTLQCDALFVWRKFKSDDNQTGVNCSVFRNEGKTLSSLLILDAEEYAKQKWTEEKRFYTYVNQGKIRSVNAGCCFKKAGWRICGLTKVNKLLIMEKLFQ